jgi:hypothetical protein
MIKDFLSEGAELQRAKAALQKALESGVEAVQLPGPQELVTLHGAQAALDRDMCRWRDLRNAVVALNRHITGMTDSMATQLEADTSNVIDAAIAGFPAGVPPRGGLTDLESEHARLLVALAGLVEKRLPAASKDVQKSWAGLARARAGVLTAILEKRLQKLAELSRPIRALENVSMVEFQDRDFTTLRVRKARDRQHEVADQLEKSVVSINPSHPMPGEAEWLALFGPAKKEAADHHATENPK